MLYLFASDILDNRVPEQVIASGIIIAVMATMYKLVRMMTSATENASARHETAMAKNQAVTIEIIQETNRFHGDLATKTNDVIVRNTIALERVMEKLKQ